MILGVPRRIAAAAVLAAAAGYRRMPAQALDCMPPIGERWKP